MPSLEEWLRSRRTFGHITILNLFQGQIPGKRTSERKQLSEESEIEKLKIRKKLNLYLLYINYSTHISDGLLNEAADAVVGKLRGRKLPMVS